LVPKVPGEHAAFLTYYDSEVVKAGAVGLDPLEELVYALWVNHD